jgi:hypothetical protein
MRGMTLIIALAIAVMSCGSEDSAAVLFEPCDWIGYGECGENLQCAQIGCNEELDPFRLAGDPTCAINYWYGDLEYFEEDCEKARSNGDNYWACKRLVCMPDALYFGVPECDPGQGWDALRGKCHECPWPMVVSNDKGYPWCVYPSQ